MAARKPVGTAGANLPRARHQWNSFDSHREISIDACVVADQPTAGWTWSSACRPDCIEREQPDWVGRGCTASSLLNAPRSSAVQPTLSPVGHHGHDRCIVASACRRDRTQSPRLADLSV